MQMLTKSMILASAIVVFGTVLTSQAYADAPATVVVRLNPETGTAENLLLSEELGSKEQAEAIVANGNFQTIDTSKIAVSELDREAGASSWYWYCAYCYSQQASYSSYTYASSYYYYGVSYTPYYYTYSSGYYYYYYSSSRSYRQSGWWH